MNHNESLWKKLICISFCLFVKRHDSNTSQEHSFPHFCVHKQEIENHDFFKLIRYLRSKIIKINADDIFHLFFVNFLPTQLCVQTHKIFDVDIIICTGKMQTNTWHWCYSHFIHCKNIHWRQTTKLESERNKNNISHTLAFFLSFASCNLKINFFLFVFHFIIFITKL